MRHFFIGDIQGCALEFEALLETSGFRRGADRLYLAGDAFARGPDPTGVFDILRDAGAKMVLGNHDDKMLQWMRWRDGELETAPAVGKAQIAAVESMESDRKELKAFLLSLPLYIETDEWILVHAAVHPTGGPPETTREIATTYRTWPGPNVPGAPKWYTLWGGPKTAVFGHDAPGGLVRYPLEGRPLAMGLDTGCVYGGRLTAWRYEDDTLHFAPARKAYYPI